MSLVKVNKIKQVILEFHTLFIQIFARRSQTPLPKFLQALFKHVFCLYSVNVADVKIYFY